MSELGCGLERVHHYRRMTRFRPRAMGRSVEMYGRSQGNYRMAIHSRWIDAAGVILSSIPVNDTALTCGI